jgi:hypothetical protein
MGMVWPSVKTTRTWGTPWRAQGVLEVSLKTTAPARVEEVPPNLVKSMAAETDDGEQAGADGAVVVDRAVVVVVGVADGEPPPQAARTASDASPTKGAQRLMPVSRLKAEESGPVRWPDNGRRRRGWPGRAIGAG